MTHELYVPVSGPSGELATRLEREAAGLAPLPPASGFPWTLVGSLAGAGALLAAAGLAFLLSRRHRHGLPRREPMPA